MIKSKAVRMLVKDGVIKHQELWVPDRGDSDLQREEWRDIDETSQPSISNPGQVQSSKTWPFPESAS